MDSNAFLELFRNLFVDTDNPDDIQLDTVFKDLDEWSSLTAFTLIAEVKVNFDKSLNGKEIRQCETVQDLYNLIVSK